MKKISIVVFMLVFIFKCNAQVNLGAGFNPVLFSGTYSKNIGTETLPNYVTEEINSTFYNVQINAGYDFPLIKAMNDNLSLGTNFNVAAGYFIGEKIISSQLSIDLPQYIVFRYGNLNESSSENKWGIGLGAGYHFRIFPLPVAVPGAFIDYTFYKAFFLRISIDIISSKYYYYLSGEGLVPAYNSRQIGVLLGYTL